MSRPVTGRDAVSPLPDHRVATDQAAFGFSQQRQGFVEAALVGLFPKGLADVVPVLLPADRPLGALVGIGGDDAEPLHQSIQQAGGFQVKCHGLGEHLIDDRHHHLDPLVADAIHAVRRGVDVFILQSTLGHASSATTGHYVAANPEDSSSLRLG